MKKKGIKITIILIFRLKKQGGAASAVALCYEATGKCKNSKTVIV